MIKCHNLQVKYGQKHVLHSIDFSAKAKEFIVILGPNGSGKSTLLHALSGVVPTVQGNIWLCDTALHTLSAQKRARHVAVVPQRLDILPRMTVHDMVLLGRYPHLSWFGMYNSHDHAAVHTALQETNAAALASRYIQELSGGELQRVLLARAFAQESPILLLDELNAGLDMARMVELFDVLDSKRQAGFCVVAVMHDINMAALYATRLIGLKHGQICFDGAVHKVFTQKNLCELYNTKIHIFPHPIMDKETEEGKKRVPQACLCR